MAKIRIGQRFRVTDGDGLLSGRVGVGVADTPQNLRQLDVDCPGCYNSAPFNSGREMLLRDEHSDILFSMFKRYLEPVP